MATIGGEEMRINTQRLELLLAERGMTKSALADKAGISRQNISTILRRGTAEPKTVGKLAVGLGVDLMSISEKET